MLRSLEHSEPRLARRGATPSPWGEKSLRRRLANGPIPSPSLEVALLATSGAWRLSGPSPRVLQAPGNPLVLWPVRVRIAL